MINLRYNKSSSSFCENVQRDARRWRADRRGSEA